MASRASAMHRPLTRCGLPGRALRPRDRAPARVPQSLLASTDHPPGPGRLGPRAVGVAALVRSRLPAVPGRVEERAAAVAAAPSSTPAPAGPRRGSGTVAHGPQHFAPVCSGWLLQVGRLSTEAVTRPSAALLGGRRPLPSAAGLSGRRPLPRAGWDSPLRGQRCSPPCAQAACPTTSPRRAQGLTETPVAAWLARQTEGPRRTQVAWMTSRVRRTKGLTETPMTAFHICTTGSEPQVVRAKLTELMRGSARLRDILALGVLPGGSIEQGVPPCVMPRDDLILVSLGPMRAIVHRDAAYILGADNGSVEAVALSVGAAVSELSSEDCPLPFELRFLEAAWEEVCGAIQRQVRLLSFVSTTIIQRLQSASFDEMPDRVSQIQPILEKLEGLRIEIQQLDRCASELLLSDEDMTAMLLTGARTGPLGPQDHAVVELMLEAYHRKLIQSSLQLEALVKKVRFGRSLSDMKLATHRNRLLRTNVQLAIGGVSVAICGTVAGFFGMNIPIPMMHHESTAEGAFAVVVGGCSLIGVTFFGSMWARAMGVGDRAAEKRRLGTALACQTVLQELAAVEKILRELDGSTDHETVNRPVFRERLSIFLGRPVSEAEVDFVFDVLDTSGDRLIQAEEVAGIWHSGPSDEDEVLAGSCTRQ
mmetsp:Transcript_104977/g.240557  ORF Transcript_104977/g.240557 Transcript_104977/m.240557 type:complete len:649 (+) Transcript_104977:3-1949(+)